MMIVSRQWRGRSTQPDADDSDIDADDADIDADDADIDADAAEVDAVANAADVDVSADATEPLVMYMHYDSQQIVERQTHPA